MKRLPTELHAIGLALAAYTAWVLTDATLKLLGATGLPVAEILSIGGVVTATLLLLWAALRRNLRALMPRNPARQVARSTLDLINNAGVVLALRHLPLALFYILVFCAPMVTALLAVPLLRESLDWRRALAVAVGFAGVVLAVDPLGLRHAASPAGGRLVGFVACAVCVLAFSTSILMSRVMTRTETPESLTFCSGLLSALAAGAVALPHLVVPAPRVDVALVASGVFGVAGSLCFFGALRRAPAAVVSQFHYSQLLTGAVVAYLVWGERLTAHMLAGAVLIVAAGVYTAARTLQSRAPEPPVPV